MRQRRIASVVLVALDRILDQHPRVCGGVGGLEVVVAVVPARAKQQIAAAHHPAVLLLVAVVLRGVDEHVADPRAVLVGGEYLRAVVTPRNVDRSIADVGAQPLGDERVGHAGAVRIVDEDVPFAVGAVGVVVVVDRRFASERAMQLRRPLDERLRVEAGLVDPRGAVLVPAGAEDHPVAADDPAVLELGTVRRGVGEGVIDPGALRRGQRFDDAPAGIAVGVADFARAGAAQGGIRRVGDDPIVRIDDVDVPLAVDAFRRVVVLDRRVAPQRAVELERALHDGLGVCAGLRLGGRTLGVPARAEQHSIVAHQPGALELGRAAAGVDVQVVHPGAVGRCQGGDDAADGIAVGAEHFGGRRAGPRTVCPVRDEYVVLVDHKQVPLAVEAFRGVVVLDRCVASVALIAGDRPFNVGAGVGGGVCGRGLGDIGEAAHALGEHGDIAAQFAQVTAGEADLGAHAADIGAHAREAVLKVVDAVVDVGRLGDGGSVAGQDEQDDQCGGERCGGKRGESGAVAHGSAFRGWARSGRAVDARQLRPWPPAPQPQEPRPQAQPPPVGIASAASSSEYSPATETIAAVSTLVAAWPAAHSLSSEAAAIGRRWVNFSLQVRQ